MIHKLDKETISRINIICYVNTKTDSARNLVKYWYFPNVLEKYARFRHRAGNHAISYGLTSIFGVQDW